MCGIAGLIEPTTRRSAAQLEVIVAAMTDSVEHRGPDDRGVWVDAATGVGLGNRRLAVVDLSPTGHQPMDSRSGRYTAVFNGEIYNFEQLRRELEGLGHVFRGRSDTEVMLASVDEWGLPGCLDHLNGMFAIACWDRETRRVSLVRDRLGEKPLYYGIVAGALMFGSELKTLRAHPDFDAEIDRDALTLLLRHKYIPAPFTIYKGVRKLPAGTWLEIDPSSLPHVPDPTVYWSAEEMARQGVAAPFRGSDADAIEHLDSLLRDAVAMRMTSDVPLGVFLSGGVDSSTIVALMQAQASSAVKTFTIGFAESDYDEASDARAVAAHLGTDHTELYVSPAKAMDVIPKLPSIFDEPFADSSQIATFLVSELARSEVTVCLSGDGGDELFGGYNRYAAVGIWNKAQRLPAPVRRLAAGSMTALSPRTWDKVFAAASGVLPRSARARTPGEKMHKLAAAMRSSNIRDVYIGSVTHWDQPELLVPGASEPLTRITNPARWPTFADPRQQMMYMDMVSYLPGDILTKVDRASMAVSLEARVPLLDHRVAELAWTLPMSMKMRDGQGKWVLRQVLNRYVPGELIDRPKMGFGVPIGDWLRGPLRAWAEELLSPQRLRSDGFLDPVPVRRRWDEHLSGRRNWQYHLWDVLMFQAWLDVQRSGAH